MTDLMTELLLRLRHVITRMGVGLDDGEDLFQDVYAECLLKRDRYQWDSPKAERLVLRMTRNVRASRRRRKNAHKNKWGALPIDVESMRGEPTQELAFRELQDTFCLTVNSLPAKYRQAILERGAGSDPDSPHMPACAGQRTRLHRAKQILKSRNPLIAKLVG